MRKMIAIVLGAATMLAVTALPAFAATAVVHVAAASTNGLVSGVNLFSGGNVPIVSDYVFDSDGWLGNFNAIYWIANLLFSISVTSMFAAIEFFRLGSSAGGLSALINMVLAILHHAYTVLGTVIPLAVLTFVGIFFWFGVVKQDVHAVWGRVIKFGLVLGMFAILVSPSFTNSQVLQNVSEFPVTIGSTMADAISGLFSAASGSGSPSKVAGADISSQIWDTLVIPEWIAGEEGQNWNVQGTAVVPLFGGKGTSAWRYILGLPLQNSSRNAVVGRLQATQGGATAFSFGNRIDVAFMASIGNIGPDIYYLLMGLVMILARIAFLILVAAGAIILPLELFPATRSLTASIKWFQYMTMTLAVLFLVTIYSAIVNGLVLLTSTALAGTVFQAASNSASKGTATTVSFVGDFVFIGNGLAYLAAILIAYYLYKKLKPMQRIKSLTNGAVAHSREARDQRTEAAKQSQMLQVNEKKRRNNPSTGKREQNVTDGEAGAPLASARYRNASRDSSTDTTSSDLDDDERDYSSYGSRNPTAEAMTKPVTPHDPFFNKQSTDKGTSTHVNVGDTGADSETDKAVKTVESAVAKGKSAVMKGKKIAGQLARPDQGVDLLVDATLGKATSYMKKVAKNRVVKVVRTVAAGRAERKAAASSPMTAKAAPGTKATPSTTAVPGTKAAPIAKAAKATKPTPVTPSTPITKPTPTTPVTKPTATKPIFTLRHKNVAQIRKPRTAVRASARPPIRRNWIRGVKS
nr:hypothetical protein [Bacilli bacterium]